MAFKIDGRMALSVPEVAETLGVSPWWVADRIRRGELRSVKIAGRRLVPVSVLDELLGGAA